MIRKLDKNQEDSMNRTILYKSRKDIISRVAEKTGMTKKLAEEAVNEVFAEITETLEDGGEMSISGFGKFEVKTRAARTGINPATKQKIEIPASKAVAFRPAKALKDAVK